jgi:hypothetical protein
MPFLGTAHHPLHPTLPVPGTGLVGEFQAETSDAHIDHDV